MEWFWWCLAALFLIQWIGIRQKKERIKNALKPPQFAIELGGALFAGIRELTRAGCFKRARDAIRLGFSPDGRRPIY